MNIKQNYKDKIVEAGKEMLAEGLTVGTWGNISLRDPETGLVYITPSGMEYETIVANDIVVLDLEMNVIDGNRVISVEKQVHLAIYRARNDVHAIMHTHPTYSSALGVVKKDLPAINKEFSQFIGDKVICSVYALPGTKELSKNVVAGLGDKRNAVILPNHGTFCVGKDIKTTFTVSHILEQSAHAYILALANGSPNILSEDDIIAIQKAKAS